MRFFSAKLLIIPLFALNALSANAYIYKYTFSASNYTDINDGGAQDGQGNLSGFFVLDTSLVNGDSDYLATNPQSSIPIPNWITHVSLTFTPDTNSGLSSETRTLTSSVPIQRMFWKVKDPSTFDPSSNNFINEMSALSFTNFGRFGTSGSLIQEYTFFDNGGTEIGAEFRLTDPVDPVSAPGPLPLLGLAPFAYYFLKFKRNLKKN